MIIWATNVSNISSISICQDTWTEPVCLEVKLQAMCTQGTAEPEEVSGTKQNQTEGKG